MLNNNRNNEHSLVLFLLLLLLLLCQSRVQGRKQGIAGSSWDKHSLTTMKQSRRHVTSCMVFGITHHAEDMS
jgi:hypothetical protein